MKRSKIDPTVIALGEEQYVLVTFSNNLSIPFEVASCKLEFAVHHKDRIKAPAISFVIPGRTKNFPVQFPFIILDNPCEKDGEILPITIKGLHITSLSRSLFISIGTSDKDEVTMSATETIPPPLSQYAKKGYKAILATKGKISITSPILELVPSQPFRT